MYQNMPKVLISSKVYQSSVRVTSGTAFSTLIDITMFVETIIEISIKVLLKTWLYLHKQLNKINSDYLHHAVIGKFGTRVSAEHVNGKDKPAQ